MPSDVHLAVIDVDGCLTPGEAGDWNWDALQAIHKMNCQARQGLAAPAITLCTGRQEPYVEVLMQAIGGYLPCIYENGCGLYFPEEHRFVEHPSVTPSVRQALAVAKTTLDQRIVSQRLGYFQPGKEVSLTLYPFSDTKVDQLHKLVREALAPYIDTLTIQASVSCVDVTPPGIDKGRGVQWLSEETGIPLTRMGGIGDSTSDLRFLRLVGRSAAPANAAAELKAKVDHISKYANEKGVLDILNRWSEGD
jgi:HAD superfamily hydrolase (TIGR01484 family)